MSSEGGFVVDQVISLKVEQHPRDAVNMTYVYPVVSRRSGGVSVGINLNPNHACNWHCAYCQVPNLQRGSAPTIDLAQLERELVSLLTDLVQGDFMLRHVPESARHLRDIALSGDGESTSAKEFPQVIELVVRVRAQFGLQDSVQLVVISNGSLIDRAPVRAGLRTLAAHGGQLWFKMDSVTPAGLRRMNGTRMSPERLQRNLRLAISLCPTWIQTCVLAWDGEPPTLVEQTAYLDFVRGLKDSGLQGVLLYGLARPSMQPEAVHLSALPQAWLEDYAAQIRACGIPARVFV
jgi:wyosine [tRNA(Phe)-imidazoG37] synthetase (radical SAM superfamily)